MINQPGYNEIASLYSYGLQRIVNDSRLLKMVIGEKVKLIQEVAYIDAAQRIHLGERKNTWEPIYISIKVEVGGRIYAPQLICCLVRRVPADGDHFLILIQIVDRHWHIIISRDDL